MKFIIPILFIILIGCSKEAPTNKSSKISINADQTQIICRVNVPVLIVRSSPDIKSKPITSFNKGHICNITETSTNKVKVGNIDAPWYKVKLNKAFGYIFSGYCVSGNIGSIKYTSDINNNYNSLCLGINNSYECAKSIENYLINTKCSHFKRNNDILEISLDNSRKLFYKDYNPPPPDEPTCKLYKYHEFISDINCHLVFVQYYEGCSYILINYKTGKEIWITNIPVMSPNKKRFFVASSGGYTKNIIQIFSASLEHVTLEWEHALDSPYNDDAIEWISDELIYMYKGADYDLITKIVLNKNNWNILE